MTTRLLLDVERSDDELVVRFGGPADHLAGPELRALLRALLSDPDDDRPVRMMLEPGVLLQADVSAAIEAAGRLAREAGRELRLSGAGGDDDLPERTWHSPLLDDDVPLRHARGSWLPAMVLAALAILAVLAPTGRADSAAPCPGADVVPVASADLAGASDAARCAVNEERTARGLPPLRADDGLDRTAARFAGRLVEETFFSHRAPDGEDLGDRLRRLHRQRGGPYAAGENLGWGEASAGTPGGMVRAWMKSPGHRAVILDRDFTRIGIGVAPGSPTGPRRTAAATYVLHAGVWRMPARTARKRALRSGRASARSRRN